LNGVGVSGCCYYHGAVWSSIVAAVATLRPCAMVVVVIAIHIVVRWRSVVVVCGCRALQAVNKLEKDVLV
jgi:hypothetical protein